MEKVVNLGIPHVGEQIFDSIDTPGLIKCVEVSQTWKVLAENVLMKKWKGKMYEACFSGETKIVQLLLDHFNAEESGLNWRDSSGCTAFMWACIEGHEDIVKLLLDHSIPNIELNARDNDGFTAFSFACFYRHREVVQLLLDNPTIELNGKSRYRQRTGFMYACFGRARDNGIVRDLLDYSGIRNIDLNARDDKGETVFMTACRIGEKDVVQLLLEHLEHSDLRIDLTVKDNYGRTALMIAKQTKRQNFVRLIELMEAKLEKDTNI